MRAQGNDDREGPPKQERMEEKGQQEEQEAHNRVGEKLAGRGPAGALCSRLIGSGRGAWLAMRRRRWISRGRSLAQTQSGQGAERIRTATSFRGRQRQRRKEESNQR